MGPRRKFRFIRELAKGGFGKVYLAEMITGEGFSTVVAIKMLHSRWSSNDEIVRRSRDEARVLGRLRHRNIVRVEDLTSIRGQCAIIMEYLEGVDCRTLSAFLAERGETMPPRAAFEVAGQVASALHAAYNHVPLQGGDPLRLVHRDIKPSNVMVTVDGDVKLLDFGTARADFEQREAETRALAFGTQAYMAPERFMDATDTPAGDVFSLGVTLYELITGGPFGKIELRPSKYDALLDERLDRLDLSGLPEDMAPKARSFIGLMLCYDPEERPTALEVVETMEILAENARGASLRRFARGVVAEARAWDEPEADPDDPLAGSTVIEDRSATFDTEGLPEAPPPEVAAGNARVEAPPTEPALSGEPGRAEGSAPEEEPPADAPGPGPASDGEEPAPRMDDPRAAPRPGVVEAPLDPVVEAPLDPVAEAPPEPVAEAPPERVEAPSHRLGHTSPPPSTDPGVRTPVSREEPVREPPSEASRPVDEPPAAPPRRWGVLAAGLGGLAVLVASGVLLLGGRGEAPASQASVRDGPAAQVGMAAGPRLPPGAAGPGTQGTDAHGASSEALPSGRAGVGGVGREDGDAGPSSGGGGMSEGAGADAGGAGADAGGAGADAGGAGADAGGAADSEPPGSTHGGKGHGASADHRPGGAPPPGEDASGPTGGLKLTIIPFGKADRVELRGRGIVRRWNAGGLAWEVADLPAGIYRVRVRDRDTGDSIAGRVTVRESKTCTYTFKFQTQAWEERSCR